MPKGTSHSEKVTQPSISPPREFQARWERPKLYEEETEETADTDRCGAKVVRITGAGLPLSNFTVQAEGLR